MISIYLLVIVAGTSAHYLPFFGYFVEFYLFLVVYMMESNRYYQNHNYHSYLDCSNLEHSNLVELQQLKNNYMCNNAVITYMYCNNVVINYYFH